MGCCRVCPVASSGGNGSAICVLNAFTWGINSVPSVTRAAINCRHMECIFLITCIPTYSSACNIKLSTAFSGGNVTGFCFSWRVIDFVGHGLCATSKLDLKNISLQSNNDHRPHSTGRILPVCFMGHKSTPIPLSH
jgi:hypothetical protein